MTCEKCGAPTSLEKQSGGTTEGYFTEEYECVNGHLGFIEGESSNPPQEWNRYGTVFEG